MLLKRFLPRPQHALTPGFVVTPHQRLCPSLHWKQTRWLRRWYHSPCPFVTHSAIELSKRLMCHRVHFTSIFQMVRSFCSVCWGPTHRHIITSPPPTTFSQHTPSSCSGFLAAAPLPKPGTPRQGQSSLLQDEGQLTPPLSEQACEMPG